MQFSMAATIRSKTSDYFEFEDQGGNQLVAFSSSRDGYTTGGDSETRFQLKDESDEARLQVKDDSDQAGQLEGDSGPARTVHGLKVGSLQNAMNRRVADGL